MVSHLLKCIKRLQLINMGGVISQPSPPIAQLESKLLSKSDRTLADTEQLVEKVSLRLTKNMVGA